MVPGSFNRPARQAPAARRRRPAGILGRLRKFYQPDTDSGKNLLTMSGAEWIGPGMNFLVSLIVVSIIWAWYRNSRHAPAQKYFTFWPRCWAGPVDGCVLLPCGFAFDLLLHRNSSPVLGLILGSVSNVVGVVYTVWLHARYGQTVGKMVCKVRVVDHLTEGPITWRQAILRECVPLLADVGTMGYLLYLSGSGALTGEAWKHPEQALDLPLFGLLSMAPFLWFVVEVVTMFSNDKRRALHDVIAGTVVVRTNVDAPTAVALEPGLYPAA